MIIKTLTRNLPVRVTHDERHQLGIDLAGCINDIASEENRQVSLKAQMKASMAELEGRRGLLASIVSSGVRYSDILCEHHADFLRGTLNVIRTDTGEILETRQLTDEERQRELPLDGGDR